MHSQQHFILSHFKDITGNFKKVSKPKETKEFGCQTEITLNDTLVDKGETDPNFKIKEAKQEIIKEYCKLLVNYFYSK